MTDTNATVRLCPGRPEHAKAIVPLVYQTAETTFDYLYDNRHDVFAKVIEASWRAEESEFSHKLATVALIDDRVVGVLISSDQPTYKEQSAKMQEIVMPLIDEPLMLHLMNAGPNFMYLSPAIPESAYFIDILSVVDDVQGMGVGKALIAHAREEAKRLGCDSIQLNTDGDGDAVGFYLNIGFTHLVETRMPELDATADVGFKYRMVEQLSASP